MMSQFTTCFLKPVTQKGISERVKYILPPHPLQYKIKSKLSENRLFFRKAQTCKTTLRDELCQYCITVNLQGLFFFVGICQTHTHTHTHHTETYRHQPLISIGKITFTKIFFSQSGKLFFPFLYQLSGVEIMNFFFR